MKLDGCGQFRNLTWWYELINATGKPILIENCHWGQTVPGDTGGDAPCAGGGDGVSLCPYNFYRTSGKTAIRSCRAILFMRHTRIVPWSNRSGDITSTRFITSELPLDCSGDITNTWSSMLFNLNSTTKFQAPDDYLQNARSPPDDAHLVTTRHHPFYFLARTAAGG